MNESNIAGLAVFVRNNHDLATDVMQMIKTRCKDENLSKCITLENFDKYLKVK